MMIEKDYIKTLRTIRRFYERAEYFEWDNEAISEYRNAVEAIDKAIEALQNKEYQALDQCPFCGGNSALHSAIDKVFWVKCEECGASTQPESTPSAAIKKWNYRVSNHKGMDLDKLFKDVCSYIENLTDEEWSIALQKAEEDSKDSYTFDNYDN